jgi:hypothetical protein
MGAAAIFPYTHLHLGTATLEPTITAFLKKLQA